MKQLVKILLGVLFFYCAASAQEMQDTNLVFKLKAKAQAVFRTNLDSALVYAKQGLTLSEKLYFDKGRADLLNTIGLVYREQNKSELALMNYNEALALAEKNGLQSLKAAVLANIGMLHEKHGDYQPALENLLAALRIREKINDDKAIGRVLNNIALVFTEMENYHKALEYYNRSVEYKLKGGDTLLAARTYNNMGIALIQLGRFEEAIAILEKALLINRNFGENGEIATNIGNLGLAYDKMGQKKKAKEHYMRCISMQKTLNLPDVELAIPINNLGTIYLEENNLSEAERLFLRSLELATERESKEDIREALGNLADVYSKEKKFELAFEYQRKFSAISDTLSKYKSGKAMAEMTVKYETEKKEEKNKILAQEIELQKLRLERSNYTIFGLALGSMLLAISGIFFYRQRKLKADQAKVVLEQKLLRSQMNPHFLFNSLQSIQGYMLTHKPEDAAGYLSDFSKLVRMILENSRKEYCPLFDIIRFNEYYLRMQSLRFEGKFDFEIYVDPQLETEHVFIPPMLLQPFIENSIEHGFLNKSDKGKIDVRIYRKEEMLMMEVEDNGIGRVAASNIRTNGHNRTSLAVAITKERIESLNRKSKGKIVLEIQDVVDENNQPKGTKVIFALPFRETV